MGHEPDVTISDYVADLRAATPSNAAELAVPDASEIRDYLGHADARCGQAMAKKLSELSGRLEDLKSRRVMETPTAAIDQKRMELDMVSSRLEHASERLLNAKRDCFVRLAAKLDALSPLKVLARGYSIAADESGNVLRSTEQVEKGDRVRLSLSDGALSCTVEEILQH